MTNEQINRGIQIITNAKWGDPCCLSVMKNAFLAMKEPDLKPMSLINTDTFNEPETETI